MYAAAATRWIYRIVSQILAFMFYMVYWSFLAALWMIYGICYLCYLPFKHYAASNKPNRQKTDSFRSAEQPFEIVKGTAMSKPKKQSSGAKTAVAAVAGIFVAGSIFGALGSDENTVQYNIRSIEMSDTDAVTLELGSPWNDSNSGKLKVSVRDKDEFTGEDVAFISENEEIATIEYTRDVFTTTLYYEINAVSAGETYIYVKANEGDAVSEKIHVIVELDPDAIIELKKTAEPSETLTPEFPDIDVSVQSEKAMADDLKSLGLFKGVSDTDYALDRAPTRIEAVVMLLRTLGKETEVLNAGYSHPFTDVPEWANAYIGYAYETGLSQGVSETEFGSGNASAAMYLTLVLRSLGYSDVDGRDFTWNDPYTLASEIGILAERVDTENFMRGDVVTISHAALSAKANGSDEPLAQQLIDAELFTMEEFNDIYYTIEELYVPETDVIETLVVPEPIVEPVPEPEQTIEPEIPVVEEPAPIVWDEWNTVPEEDNAVSEPVYVEPAPEPVWTEPVQTITIVHEDSSMTQELIEQLEGIAVFWAPTGQKTHLSPQCSSFKKGLISHFAGTLEQAQTVRTEGWCKNCAEILFGKSNDTFYARGNSYATTDNLASSYTYNDYLNGIPSSAFDD